ncbi:hypothetical protein ACJX0J_016464, partial [Zea mays]
MTQMNMKAQCFNKLSHRLRVVDILYPSIVRQLYTKKCYFFIYTICFIDKNSFIFGTQKVAPNVGTVIYLKHNCLRKHIISHIYFYLFFSIWIYSGDLYSVVVVL